MKKDSSLAVLMAAYNAESTLLEAVDSILNHHDTAVMYIVDDASKIPVADLLAQRPQFKKRIHIIRLKENGGQAKGRNIGIQAILKEDYTYIAMMDADDISYPGRLQKQVAFLDNHPDIAAVGSWSKAVDEKTLECVAYRRHPVTPEEVRKNIYFDMGFTHSTIVLRSRVLNSEGGYSEKFPIAQDYELVSRLLRRGYKLANLPEYLLDYRLTTSGISYTKARKQKVACLKIKARQFRPWVWQAWAGIIPVIIRLMLPDSWVRDVKTKLGMSFVAGSKKA